MNDILKTFGTVLPHVTSKRIARLTGHTQRVVQRWISGELAVPPPAYDVVVEQAKKLQGGWPAQVLGVVEEGNRQGLHPEVIASHLAAEYKKLTGADLE